MCAVYSMFRIQANYKTWTYLLAKSITLKMPILNYSWLLLHLQAEPGPDSQPDWEQCGECLHACPGRLGPPLLWLLALGLWQLCCPHPVLCLLWGPHETHLPVGGAGELQAGQLSQLHSSFKASTIESLINMPPKIGTNLFWTC